MHICVGRLIIIGSDNGFSSGLRQASIWTNVGILLIVPLGTNLSAQWNLNRNSFIFIAKNAFENVVWKMAAILSRPQCVKAFIPVLASVLLFCHDGRNVVLLVFVPIVLNQQIIFTHLYPPGNGMAMKIPFRKTLKNTGTISSTDTTCRDKHGLCWVCSLLHCTQEWVGFMS